MNRILLDVSHTSHTRARTGIQRVVRSVRSALGDEAVGVTFDPYRRCWRQLQRWEVANLAATTPGRKRGAHWPVGARVRGRLCTWLRVPKPALPSNGGLVMPELFSPAVGRALPGLFARTSGPRVALFHDAIALKLPEMTPAGTVARFPAYLEELLAFDGIAAVSEDSRSALVDYWKWAGVASQPPVVAIPLGIDRPARGGSAPRSGAPVVLSVGSIEGRKNHSALLDACEALWAKGLQFELRLIGLAQPQTGRAALDRIRELKAAGRPLRYAGAADDRVLQQAYWECAFTVYPSLMEGFGLPVLESLSYGKPCICSERGALGESARGGGCITVREAGSESLANAIEQLLTDPTLLHSLASEATARNFRTWDDYVRDLRDWMSGIRRTQ